MGHVFNSLVESLYKEYACIFIDKLLVEIAISSEFVLLRYEIRASQSRIPNGIHLKSKQLSS